MAAVNDVIAATGPTPSLEVVRGLAHKNVGIFAESLRRPVESLSIPWESFTPRFTISLGVASLDGVARRKRSFTWSTNVSTRPKARAETASDGDHLATVAAAR